MNPVATDALIFVRQHGHRMELLQFRTRLSNVDNAGKYFPLILSTVFWLLMYTKEQMIHQPSNRS